MYYNFRRIYQTLRVTPAMKAGIADRVGRFEEVVSRLDGAMTGRGGIQDSGVVLILTGICICLGIYLIVRPQQYKEELEDFEDVISRSPRWAIRLLGVFTIAVGIGVFYLFLTTLK